MTSFALIGAHEAVEAVLKRKPEWSDSRIAEHAGVSHPTVASVRAELEKVAGSPQPTERIGRDGKRRRFPHGLGTREQTPEVRGISELFADCSKGPLATPR